MPAFLATCAQRPLHLQAIAPLLRTATDRFGAQAAPALGGFGLGDGAREYSFGPQKRLGNNPSRIAQIRNRRRDRFRAGGADEFDGQNYCSGIIG